MFFIGVESPGIQLSHPSINHIVPGEGDTVITCTGTGKPSPLVEFGGLTCSKEIKGIYHLLCFYLTYFIANCRINCSPSISFYSMCYWSNLEMTQSMNGIDTTCNMTFIDQQGLHYVTSTIMITESVSVFGDLSFPCVVQNGVLPIASETTSITINGECKAKETLSLKKC